MLNFSCDYLQGCHPKILEKLVNTNDEKTPGYGSDIYTISAKEKILKCCNCKDGEVFFLVGGTQTNAIVIKSLLRSYQGVIAPDTGHITVHEAGAIEMGGHKIIAVKNENGKITSEDVLKICKGYYDDENHQHMVMPGMVYISFPTEVGTLYSKQELTDLSKVCKEYNIPLFLDGARLGYGLKAKSNDLTIEDIAQLVDVFYIGGTKVGALFGEALVITKKNLIPGLFSIIKQNGALLAKGRMLGIQFDTLFTNNLYFDISKNAIDKAELIKKVLFEKGYNFYIDSPTNQIFIIMNKERLSILKEKVIYSFWENLDDNNVVIRLATSWSTTDDEVEELIKCL